MPVQNIPLALLEGNMKSFRFLVTPIIFDDGKAMHIQPISAHPACRKQCQIGKGISTQVDENVNLL